MSICRSVFLLLLSGGFTLAVGCSSSPRFTRGSDKTASSPPSVTRTPSPRNTSSKPILTLEGIASYYADDFHGKQAANGEVFDMNALTAAHRTFPFGTQIRVTNLTNSKVVVVRVNDRGPFKEGRIIDLSLGAARKIDLIQTGTAKVRLEVLQWGDGTLHHKK